jgi:hypothetical protein
VPGPRPWLRVFPGEARQLGLMWRWLAALLPDDPARDDIASIATELAGNAVAHTASGQGGSFAVAITRHCHAIRVAVADAGAPGEPTLICDPEGQAGRGLLIVRGLATGSGFCGDEHGRLVWADIRPEHPCPAGPEQLPLPGDDIRTRHLSGPGDAAYGAGERAPRQLLADGII